MQLKSNSCENYAIRTYLGDQRSHQSSLVRSSLSMSEATKQIACGSIAGAVGKLVEYPFDTTKVRLQTQSVESPKYSGALDCLRKTVQEEGFYGLYRGVASPIVGAAAENAVLFYAYSLLNPIGQSLQQHGVGSTGQAAVQGCGAGICASFVLTPIELIKCKVQVSHVAGVEHKSIKSHVIDIWQDGRFRGFWKGQTGTLLREAGGSAAWFGTYDGVKSLMPDSLTSQLIAGACAGIGYNLALFPADTAKSVIQTNNIMNRESHGFIGTLAKLYAQGGIRSWYKGLGITCARAAPSSAIIFLVYDRCARFMGLNTLN